MVFVPQANDRFYDLSGALGFISATFVSLYYPYIKARFWNGMTFIPMPPLSSLAPRQMLLNAAIVGWSVRLGVFLGMRTIKSGGNSFFEEVKHQPVKFTGYWIGQAFWNVLVGLPVYLVNIMPSKAQPSLELLDYYAVALFAGSWLFEIVADYQKSAWRRAKDGKQHHEKFIRSGLWSISRHPNYVGEVGLWTGIWLLSVPSLRSTYFPASTWLWTAASPLIMWVLLRYISGVPPLEESADKKFGKDPEWQEYKRTVPIFWPWGSRG
ncbi:hypothetical protein CERSUDRAFT_141597 [Gelatoporia subvermispora B]|uniref:Uncharacterized protein n=1 Tax=Ceriporiopsis subvermispora (strain B) TaxID=914234 RepID=M2QPL1_CERS8|nr:hypothetical protein CERSUDRAFT_141597 [Gelatoporia subvermispora B]